MKTLLEQAEEIDGRGYSLHERRLNRRAADAMRILATARADLVSLLNAPPEHASHVEAGARSDCGCPWCRIGLLIRRIDELES